MPAPAECWPGGRCPRPDGYAESSALGERHTGLPAWAMEGTGGYSAGLARHLAGAGELVIELDRLKRPARRAEATSDPIDAERAARDARARTRLAQPKTGAERAALQMRLTARRAAVEAATAAQRQLLALIITAPGTVRTRSATRPPAPRSPPRLGCAQLPAAVTSRSPPRSRCCDLARRARTLEAEGAEHEQAIRTLVRTWRPDCSS